MENAKVLILNEIIRLIKSSEKKFRQNDYKGAIEDKIEANVLLKKDLLSDSEIENKYKKELSIIYYSKFDLINDHKKKINNVRRNQIINLLEQKSKDKYISGDFKGSIKALRRADKYKID